MREKNLKTSDNFTNGLYKTEKPKVMMSSANQIVSKI